MPDKQTAYEEVKPYLDYLDKEMTIMGILSAFCIAALALAIERVSSPQGAAPLALIWSKGYIYFLAGSGSMLLASLFFYRERSLLAWYYGQITLFMAKNPTPNDQARSELKSWLEDADSWATWISYPLGFGFLTVAFIEYGLTILSARVSHVYNHPFVYALVPILGATILLTIWVEILKRHKYEEEPFKAFRECLKKKLQPGTNGQDHDWLQLQLPFDDNYYLLLTAISE